MKIRERSFPYPVLSSENDDVDAAFQAPIEVRKVGEIFEVNILCQMSSDDLQAKIDAGDAAYGLHVECTRSFFREIYPFTPKNGRGVIQLERENLRGPVELNVVVYATKELRKYRITGSHEDYGNRSFYVAGGDFLAVTEGTTFNAEIHQDMLESVSSIIEIVKRQDKKPVVGVYWDTDRIQIWLPERDYGLYCQIRKSPSFISIQLSSIILPVLMQAVEMVASREAEYEHTRWHDNLIHRMNQKNVPLDGNPFESAQQLLDYPIRETLEKIYREKMDGVMDEE
ncbi:MAG: hypothetical protein WD049_10055 [Candidatus Paceibacterota bacterium]